MRIKGASIEGFKSYGSRVDIGQFSPSQNVIVGLNGGGKSNFYKAIEFVLLDEYSKLSMKERDSVLYEGRGKKASEANIELIFDNKERKIPIDRDEISIGRKISIKKDEFFINGKKNSWEEVHNLLESSGFSPSSGYNIVRQGNVNSLAIMKDSDRYELICDIAGTKFYDNQKDESMTIIKETVEKREQINNSLELINQRVSQLEKEKKVLERYQALENEKNSIEYAIQSNKKNKSKKMLEEKENEMDSLCKKLTETENFVNMSRENMSRCKYEMDIILSKIDNAMNGKKKIDSEKEIVAKELTCDEFHYQEALSELERSKVQHECLQNKIFSIKKDIDDKKEILAPLQEEFNIINKELVPLESIIGGEVDVDIESISAELSLLEKNIHHYEPTCCDYSNQMDQICYDISEKKKLLINIIEKISEILAREGYTSSDLQRFYGIRAEIINNIDMEKENLRKIELSMEKSISHTLASGISFIRKIKNEGIIGIVAELISSDPCYYNAIETVAKNRLFNVITDKAKTAQEMVSLLCKNESGRITFMPLDKIYSKNNSIHVPNRKTLLSLINFDSKIKPAIEMIFGSTILVDDLADAEKISKNYRVDCVTISGEFVSFNGFVTGGSIPNHQPYLKMISSIADYRQKVVLLEKHNNNISMEILEKENELKYINEELSSNQEYKSQIVSEVTKLDNSMRTIDELIESEKNNNHAKSEIRVRMEQRICLLRGILDSNGRSSHSSSKTMIQKRDILKRQANSLQMKIEEISNEISNVLIPLRMHISNDISIIDLRKMQNESDDLQIKYLRTKKEMDEIEFKLSEIIKLTSDLESQKFENEEQYSCHKNEYEDFSSLHKELLKSFDTLSITISSLKDELKESNLPYCGDIEKYSTLTHSELLKNLKKIIHSIQEIGYVNNRAQSQYDQFIIQKSNLTNRMKSLEENEASIISMIESLDQRKEESIRKTFNSISSHFTDIFSQLSTRGTGTLLLNDHAISISVSLDGADEPMLLNQLSGGQKSLVALSMVFAIQRAMPAPFYLLDEVDAALDPIHRESLSLFIKESSSQAQYILTTFKPELARNSETIFALSFEHDRTISRVITQQEAEILIVDN